MSRRGLGELCLMQGQLFLSTLGPLLMCMGPGHSCHCSCRALLSSCPLGTALCHSPKHGVAPVGAYSFLWLLQGGREGWEQSCTGLL